MHFPTCIFSRMVNSSKLVETHFPAFTIYYCSVNSWKKYVFCHSQPLELTSRKHAFSSIFCNGEFELIRTRHAFSSVYRRSVNCCSSNSIQWISSPGFNYTEGSKSILSYFPLPDRISTPLTILNKFINAQ